MKKLIISLIKLYRYTISPYMFVCKYRPTCSEYAIDAVTEHGAIKGSLLTIWRLLRCNPFSKGGFDPVKPRKN